MDDFVTIAQIVKKRGIRGEVAAQLLTANPERFSAVHRVRIHNRGREYWEELEEHWFHGNRVILKFRGRDRPEEIQELIGGEVQIPGEERLSLPEDAFYHSDLIGCEVLEKGYPLGIVKGIFEATGEVCHLVVEKPERKGDFMIPLVREFIRKVDTENKVIEVDLPEGLVNI